MGFVRVKASTIPMVADDDCIIPVKREDIISAVKGLSRVSKKSLNQLRSLTIFTAPDISSIPYIKREKPISERPMLRLLCVLPKKFIATPKKEIKGTQILGLSMVKSKPVRLIIQALRVVPTFEPKITPNVFSKGSKPEFTRPTSITVSVEEEWRRAVMALPKMKPSLNTTLRWAVKNEKKAR